MYAMLSIHNPHPEHESALIDSMHRFSAACASQLGLIQVGRFKDAATGRVFCIVLWESQEAAIAAAPVFRDAVKDDDFETWEREETQGMRLSEI